MRPRSEGPQLADALPLSPSGGSLSERFRQALSHPHPLRRMADVVIVACVVALATLLRYWLGSRFGVAETYVTFFPAVLILATAFGVASGIWATVLSAMCADLFFLRTAHHLALGTTGEQVGLSVFIGSSVLLSLTAGALRTRTDRMRLALELLESTRERASDERRRFDQASERFQTVVQSSDEAITTIDASGILTSWNKGAETIFGYTAEEIVGRPFRALLPAGPASDAEALDILSRLRRGEVIEKLNVQRVTKDGQIVHVNLTVAPTRDEAGGVIGASAITRDISETVKLQRQLQQSQKLEAIGQLAGGIAHDFNNLLAIILGALELQLPSLAGNAEASHRWEVAHRAAVRGAELTRRLLAFSSQEHFKIASTDLNHSLRNTMEMAQRLIGPEIKVALNLEKNIARVLVDPSGLESAVLNLVINARDAMMPRGGSLTVSTRTAELEQDLTATLTGAIQPGSYACVSISDTGCGMPPEVLDRACEPFFTTKERGRGTGLGLSMVYGFVKHSGGGIRIYSETGYGTTVTFYLPFDRAAAPAAQPRSEKLPDPKRAGRILIVDDEAELLDISASYLQSRGYAALSAHDGKDALRVLQESGHVDVLITDIVMGGGMDGMELAQAVHRSSPSTRVIYSSGFPADALSGRNLPLADALVLQKPYRLAELAASVEQALGIR